MFWIIVVTSLLFAGWITYELYRAPNIEDDNSSLNTNEEWDDNKNHTEGSF